MHTASSGSPSTVKFSPNCPWTRSVRLSCSCQWRYESSWYTKTARCSPPCPARSPWPSPSRFNRPTRQRRDTGSFQIPVCTVRPFHAMSRGSPTFTDNSRAMSLSGRSQPLSRPRRRVLAHWLFEGEHLGNCEAEIGAVGNHRLAGSRRSWGPVELYRDNIGLERHQVGDAADLGIGL